MIASLRGKPVARTAEGLVLDVGGVGYLVHATPRALARADGPAEVTLPTYLAVREDALQLYGFADADERELFVHLLAVNGIGPKGALAVVSGSPAPELRRAIALGDAARFQAIPGIGKKTAERIVLELKEKLADEPIPISSASGTSPHVIARDALVELGYTIAEAEQALADVDPELPAEEREQSLRPRRLADFVGQERIKEQLSIALDATRAREEALDHVLLVGPPGLGKTSLAYIIRTELGVGLRSIADPAL